MDACLAPGEYLGQTVAKRQFGELFLTESGFEPNAVLASHVHEAATICFVLQGAFEEHSDRGRTLAEPGLLIYRPGGHRHSDRFLNTKGRTLGLDLSSSFSRLPLEPVTSNAPQFGRISSHIYQEFRRNDGCSGLAVEGWFLLLQAEMTRTLTTPERNMPGWLRQVEERLRDQYLSTVSVAELARFAGVHPVHLSREFHRFFGCTIGQFVRKLRVEHGRRRLSSAELSIGEVSVDAGFCDQSHFTRAFRELTGMTPGEYRNQSITQ